VVCLPVLDSLVFSVDTKTKVNTNSAVESYTENIGRTRASALSVEFSTEIQLDIWNPEVHSTTEAVLAENGNTDINTHLDEKFQTAINLNANLGGLRSNSRDPSV
jgi:hypothetical protein